MQSTTPLSPTMQAEINRQITAEIHSGQIYLWMATWFENYGLTGMAKWMRKQVSEERGHADRFIEYMTDHNHAVIIDTVPAIASTIGNNPVVDLWETTMQHERLITALIKMLKKLAIDEQDWQTSEFLNWFLHEQVEEESVVQTVLDRLTIAAGNSAALLQLDHELGER